MRVEIYPFYIRTKSGSPECGNSEVIEWPVNTRMTSRMFKIITEAMRFRLNSCKGCERVVASVYNGVMNPIMLAMDPEGTMHMISYHPGKMDAVMSICTVRRGGVRNA